MPPLTRRFIKAGLIYLLAAFFVRLLLALQAVIDLPALILSLMPVYFHLFMVGWVAQLIFGIVYWMFPKYSRENPRRNETLAAAIFYLLNIGLLLRVAGEPALFADDVRGWLLLASALLQWLAGLGFVINTWARVKAR